MRLWARRHDRSEDLFCSVGLWVWLGFFAMLVPSRAEDFRSVPISVFATQVAAARQVIEGCAQSATACDPAGLPAREQVQGAPGGTFFAGWNWLREGLEDARTGSPADRTAKMKAAEAHLAELAAEAGATVPPEASGEFGRARAAANAALAREEFRATGGPTWIERQISRVQDWILRLFNGMDRLGRRAPWLAPAVEWSCFGLAAAGLLWFVRQSLARQALRISLSEAAALGARDGLDSGDWAQRAQQRAAAEDWREAIHCLYWAAIALMEGRRAWKPNATRTPREYLRLLKPGSEAQGALGELTRLFERIWYGHGEAGATSYELALRSFHALEAARPERTATASMDVRPGALPAAGGA